MCASLGKLLQWMMCAIFCVPLHVHPPSLLATHSRSFLTYVQHISLLPPLDPSSSPSSLQDTVVEQAEEFNATVSSSDIAVGFSAGGDTVTVSILDESMGEY